MVSVTIVTMLLSVAVPVYDDYIFSSKFDEAKMNIQKIVIAQEKYKIETGSYYTDTSEVKNEDVLYEKLKVDLSASNNFVYFLKQDGNNFIIKAVLRDNSWAVCSDLTTSVLCKQNDHDNKVATTTADVDEWVQQYKRGESNHFIRYRYPTLYKSTDTNIIDLRHGIDYTKYNDE